VYYVTVPLLTGIWLDWKSEKGEGTWEDFKKTLENNLVAARKWISTILVLLSILAPRFISPITAEQVDNIINTLQTLRF
jgi:hypothetical protein